MKIHLFLGSTLLLAAAPVLAQTVQVQARSSLGGISTAAHTGIVLSSKPWMGRLYPRDCQPVQGNFMPSPPGSPCPGAPRGPRTGPLYEVQYLSEGKLYVGVFDFHPKRGDRIVGHPEDRPAQR